MWIYTRFQRSTLPQQLSSHRQWPNPRPKRCDTRIQVNLQSRTKANALPRYPQRLLPPPLPPPPQEHFMGLTHLITGHSKEGDIRPRKRGWENNMTQSLCLLSTNSESQQANNNTELDVTSTLLCFFISQIITFSPWSLIKLHLESLTMSSRTSSSVNVML